MPPLRQAVTPSWTATLRLPRSRFPPRPILEDRTKYLQRCSDDLYDWQNQAKAPQSRPFVLHDGPPYANGSLHVGHALNKILKDITNRTRLLRGYRVDYVPGWDCHGLPIELKALQQGDLDSSSAKQLSAAEVRARARRLALRTVEEQKSGFKQWAVLGDWDNAWKTTDKRYELAQLRVFKTLLEKGLIYQNNKPVYWSPSSRTALAEAELEYKADHESTAAFVKFPLLEVPRPIKDAVAEATQTVSVAIWTTTPWTLVANKAIAVHETLEYVLVRSQTHGLLIVAASRLSEVGRVCNEELSDAVILKLRGAELVGAGYSNPLLGSQRRFPILHAGFVSSESGTGVVHMAPGHGMDDYKLCQFHGIQPFAPVDDIGCFTAEALPQDPRLLQGQHVLKEGNGIILDMLAVRHALIHSHTYKHSYPYDWRSKQPVIIRATRQWFANVESKRDATIRSLDAVKFVPESGKERLSSFVRSRTEWCISRQRPWGVPIPALYRDQEALMTPESVEHIITTMDERGSEAWWTDDRHDPSWVVPSLRSTGEFYRGQDTMDVWFDSGTSWTQMASGGGDQFPVADVYLEGTDQHRGWFQSSLLTRVASQSGREEEQSSAASAPYRTLITHGFTLDQHGSKMSKSIGNTISPDEIMQGTLLPPVKRKPAKGSKDTTVAKVTHDALGPDALRMWVASSDYTRDMAISVPVLQAVNSSVTKIRVTFKLLLGFVEDYKPGPGLHFQDLEMNNQLALIKLQRLTDIVQGHYDTFEYHKAVNAINNYIAADLSAGYVEAIKDRMYTDAAASPRRAQTQAVLWEIFKKLADILSPVVPLLVEEALDYLPAHLSYNPIHAAWQTDPSARQTCIESPWTSSALDELTPYLHELNVAVKALQEQARSEKKMGSSLQSDVIVYAPLPASRFRALLEKYREPVEDMLVISHLRVSDHSSPPSTLGTDDVSQEGEWSFTTTVTVNEETVHVAVTQPAGSKCVRCWKNVVPDQPELEESLCIRCVGIIEGLRTDMPELLDGKPGLDEAARKCRHSSDTAMQGHWAL